MAFVQAISQSPPNFNLLSWRKITPLHKNNGAQSVKVPLVMSAGVQQTLFQFPYNSNTIDRVIGVYLGLGGVPGVGAAFALKDLNSGWVYNQSVANFFGNYWFNMETLVDGANIVATSSVNITSAMNAIISLYNIEIVPCSMGGG